VNLTVVTPLADRLGGSEHMLWHILRHAHSAHLTPRVICLRDGPFVDEVEGLGIPSCVVDTGRLREVRRGAGAIARLARLLRNDPPDVVLSWLPKGHLYAGPASVAAGLDARTVWWQHSVAGAWMDRAATVLPAAAVGCSSHAVAASQRRLRPRRTTFVVHPGVDPVAPSGAGVSAESLGIPPGRPIVAVVGRLQPGKGQHRVLEAVSILRDRGVDLHLVMVGGDAHGLSPAYAERVRRLVHTLGLGDRTTVTGHVPSALPYIALGDILVSGSDSEAFGLVLVEAMMAGAAVVAVDAGGPAEIIDHERSGLLLADGRPCTIAAGLERVLRDDTLRRRLGDAGRRRALEHFSAAAMTHRLAEALRAVVSAEPPSRARRPSGGARPGWRRSTSR
jgi:glycosyltransferase involved in cell wall biosynthesis